MRTVVLCWMVLMSVPALCGIARGQNIEWERYYTEPASVYPNPSEEYEGRHLLPMPDGGYVVTGYCGLSTSAVLRLDSEGNRLWEHRVEDDKRNIYPEHGWEGELSSFLKFSFLREDGRVVFLGNLGLSHFSDHGSIYMLVIDDETGATLDTIAGLHVDSVTSIDKDAVVCRSRSGEFMVVSVWDYSAKPDTLGWLYIDGFTSRGRPGRWWSFVHAGEDREGVIYQVPVSLVQAEDDNFVLLGHQTNDTNGLPHLFLLKMDNRGNVIWQREPGKLNSVGAAVDLVNTADGGFVGAYWDHSQFHDPAAEPVATLYAIKFDRDGNTEWERELMSREYLVPKSICQTEDGGYAIAGYSSRYDSLGNYVYEAEQWLLVRLDSNGYRESLYEWGDTTLQGNRLFDVIGHPDGSVIVTGEDDWYPAKLYVAKIGREVAGATGAGTGSTAAASMQVVPNPANDRVRIEWHAGTNDRERIRAVRLYDLLGRSVLEGKDVAGMSGSVELDVSEIPAGTYRAVGESENGSAVVSKAVVLIR